MKKFLILFATLFCTVAFAETITLNWLNEDRTINQTTTCNVGGDVVLPTAPTKYGYTFLGWTVNYIPIEYLESTGTQYIDTGIIPTNDTRVKVKAQFLRVGVGEWDNIVGSKSNESLSKTRFYPFGTNKSTNKFRFTYGTNQIEINWDLNVHTVDFNNSYRQVVFDGLIVGTLNDSTYTSTASIPMTLFAYNLPAGIDTTSLSVARIYEYEVYQGSQLVQNLLPVIDRNGTPCMYDKVTQQFFYNQGTGDFIAGPVVGSGE